MGRRLSLVIGMALAVGAGAAVWAGPAPMEDPPAATAPPQAALPAELPADFAKPGGPTPANLGPEPPSAGPPVDAKAGPSPLGALMGKLKAAANGKPAAAPPGPATKDPAVTPAQTPVESPAPVAPPEAVPPPLPAPADPGPPPTAVAPPDMPAAPAEPPAAAAPRDPALEPSQAVGAPPAATQPPPVTPVAPPDTGPLPPATVPPGAKAAAEGAPGEPKSPFVLAPDELPMGRQNISLTVDVVAPQVLNLNQTATFKIVVRNAGTTDARGVVVRDQLPDGLTLVSSQPEAERIDALLAWNLGTVGAGSEKLVTLSVKPTRTGSYDHAATVTMMVGGKSRTIVRQPKLKVEQTAASAKVLLGQPIQFKIAVSNPGDGPARNVVVQAKLSPGLRHESIEPSDQNLLEQTIDLIGPGERVVLDTLSVDARQGGEQSCKVLVVSPDVVEGSPEAQSVVSVTVVEPKLAMKINGPESRYTDTLATYEVSLENPGTATAQNVRIQAIVPVSGRLHAVPEGARFDAQTRRLSWTRSQLQPGEKAVYSFQMRVGGVGLYQVAAEARAESGLLAKDTKSTDVTGLADVVFNVAENRRVVDVDDETTYTIKISNIGTKEATRLSISAVLSANLEAVQTSGTDAQSNYNPAENRILFPLIERLGPNKSIELGIRVKVKGTEPRIATCRVFLAHDDLSEKLDDVAAFKVTPTRRQ